MGPKSVGEIRRSKKNMRRPAWSRLKVRDRDDDKDGIGDVWDGNFGTANYVHQRQMTAAERAQALAAQKRAAAIAKNNANRYLRNRGGGRIQDPYLRHQNYMANNFMDAARARYQHMKKDPSGYSQSRYGNDYYAPINKPKVWQMRAEDDWRRKMQGLSPRNWRNMF